MQSSCLPLLEAVFGLFCGTICVLLIAVSVFGQSVFCSITFIVKLANVLSVYYTLQTDFLPIIIRSERKLQFYSAANRT